MTTILTEQSFPIASVFDQTRYFEIDSKLAGARYAVWVTVPLTYAVDPMRRFPIIYQPDGNSRVLHSMPVAYDPIAPIQPFISVCVGYNGQDARRRLAVRARDLLPPGEPLPTMYDEDTIFNSIVDSGYLDREGCELYLKYLRAPAADRFLAFLEEELHPLIAREFRIDEDRVGFFGYSYGGLCATYLAMRRSRLFMRIGAGSPGILPGVSRIFELYRNEIESGTDHSGRALHMSVCTTEVTAPTDYQFLVGQGTCEFMALAGQKPLPGLDFSCRIIEHETHASGFAPSWHGFLRTLYRETD